jgi:hypothetical protein
MSDNEVTGAQAEIRLAKDLTRRARDAFAALRAALPNLGREHPKLVDEVASCVHLALGALARASDQREIDNLSDALQGRDAERRTRSSPGDAECPTCGFILNPNPMLRTGGTPGRCCARALGLVEYVGMPDRGKA